jgi:hypothetical protein
MLLVTGNNTNKAIELDGNTGAVTRRPEKQRHECQPQTRQGGPDTSSPAACPLTRGAQSGTAPHVPFCAGRGPSCLMALEMKKHILYPLRKPASRKASAHSAGGRLCRSPEAA